MNDLLFGLLSALVATNPPAVVSNLVYQKAGVTVAVATPNPQDPVEQALQKLLDEDDAAQAEVDKWILERQQTGRPESDVEKAVFRSRILRRFDPVKKGYEQFLETHPDHARARLAYGSFLNDIGQEEAAEAQWERARDVDPKNPAAWDNLATLYGHNGNARKSFEYYGKAIELAPGESIYYQNLATVVFMFRKDAMEYYHITEQEVFAKAMELYNKALSLDPENFRLAAEVAQTYYGIKPPKTGDAQADRRAEGKLTQDALAAWAVALKLADTDLERESVHLHFTRWQINSGQFEEARRNLNRVTNEVLAASKRTLLKKLANREAASSETNRLSKPNASP